MREQLGLDFAEIRLRLNKERIAKGKDPNLSNSGVANRYNRTAPVLFSASGMSFVPLNERGNMNGRQKVAWSDKNDNILVACVKEFEAKKWAEVAAMFNERSGQNADDECVSSRYTML
ncbi:hypothetical protein BJ875DRAFT_471686 [Amylocarpus encephaloides]|uniref:Myb-like domain-containing protein n=1 Tax=Amylocarpus encephaloides TaxID=45428 RepID=A0A9P8C345_9HELO|nr:hypothetical protein BJ875DRAFT_471686 [Amylocarpus encephaloides]